MSQQGKTLADGKEKQLKKNKSAKNSRKFLKVRDVNILQTVFSLMKFKKKQIAGL